MKLRRRQTLKRSNVDALKKTTRRVVDVAAANVISFYFCGCAGADASCFASAAAATRLANGGFVASAAFKSC